MALPPATLDCGGTSNSRAPAAPDDGGADVRADGPCNDARAYEPAALDSGGATVAEDEISEASDSFDEDEGFSSVKDNDGRTHYHNLATDEQRPEAECALSLDPPTSSGPGGADQDWYYVDQSGVAQGPIDDTELEDWLKCGNFDEDTRVSQNRRGPFRTILSWIEHGSDHGGNLG